jgi:hypothetical protein
MYAVRSTPAGVTVVDNDVPNDGGEPVRIRAASICASYPAMTSPPASSRRPTPCPTTSRPSSARSAFTPSDRYRIVFTEGGVEMKPQRCWPASFGTASFVLRQRLVPPW